MNVARSVADVPGEHSLPMTMLRAARQWLYASPVFLAPPWPEIFTVDAERTQTADFAARVYQTLQATYQELGYRTVELPRVSPAGRADFVVAQL